VWHVGGQDYDADSALFKETTWTHEGAVHDREVAELHPWAKGGSQPTLRVNWVGEDTPFHRVVAFLFSNPDGVPERRWVGGWGCLCWSVVGGSYRSPAQFPLVTASVEACICCRPRSFSCLPSEITWKEFNASLVVRDRNDDRKRFEVDHRNGDHKRNVVSNLKILRYKEHH
jgi:hypothetical protein